MIEDAQRQAGRAGRTITNETLLLFATTTMLTTERFPRANDDCEERAERDKTWLQWNLAYNKVHAKARIKVQANGGTVKFDAANSTAHQETALTEENQQGVDDCNMMAFKGYFDNLAVTAVNEKSVLQQLVSNNTKLAASNKSLVALVKQLTGDIKNLERNNSHLKKGRQGCGQSTNLYHRCKKEGYHQPYTCYRIVKNKDTRHPGRISLL